MRERCPPFTSTCLAAAALVAASNACAQTGPSAPATSSAPTNSSAPANSSAPTSLGGGPGDPNPYYIGVSQALTHDSNVYRVPSGPSDNYSSTSLFGGFDQRISRQRLFGRANVSVNRYQDQDQLNNVSYALSTGLDWETIERLSGSVNASLNRSLASPTATAGVPVASRNVAETSALDARIRWGGVSVLTLEGGLGYSRLDYSDPVYSSAESNQTTASLGLYYRPGGPLRLGVAVRGTRTKTPKAFIDPATGTYQSTTLNGRNLDLLADYELTGQLAANGRLSYTKQTNSGVSNADFSGLTGSLGLNWQATGKTSFRLDASRDVGFNATPYRTLTFAVGPTGIVLTPVTGLYQNNQVTTSAGLSVNYAATAKISANAGVRYARARLTAVNAGTAGPDVIDVSKAASLGANYEITRNWGLGCNVSHERRNVSGGTSFSYTANSVGCSTQFVWR